MLRLDCNLNWKGQSSSLNTICCLVTFLQSTTAVKAEGISVQCHYKGSLSEMLLLAISFRAVPTSPNKFLSLTAIKACTFQSCCLKTQSLEHFLALARILQTQGLKNCSGELKCFLSNTKRDRASRLCTSWYLISISEMYLRVKSKLAGFHIAVWKNERH